MGDCSVIGRTTNRRVRQSAIRIFAQEYKGASLVQQGIGEYDPSFVITRLGAKVNRCLVAGVIDRLERRESESGQQFFGQIRDPTGEHYFSVASFQPELHAETEELLARFESGDRFLLAMIGRARWSESDDGGVFTSIRAEDFTVIDQDRYKLWLVEAADATLRRLEAYTSSTEVDLASEGDFSSEVPEDLVEGMTLARGHYSEFDSEVYRVGILRALSLASGRSESIEMEGDIAEEALPVNDGSKEEKGTLEQIGEAEARDVIIGLLNSRNGQLVEYDDIVGACTSAGVSREEAEETIDYMMGSSKEIMEPRFGFFQIAN